MQNALQHFLKPYGCAFQLNQKQIIIISIQIGNMTYSISGY